MVNLSDIECVVVDFEGTIVSIASVRDVLFPYARKQIEAGYVERNQDQLGDILAGIRTEAGNPDLTVAECTAQLLLWMDGDKKIGPLKILQGMIWHDGYTNGDLKGQLYDDAAAQLTAWYDRGMRVVGYSSGSVQAQEDLIANTEKHGDMSGIFARYFDTKVGTKQDPASYATIAKELGVSPAHILFLSDVPGELKAAQAAGFQVVGSVRDGNKPEDIAGLQKDYPYVTDFTHINIQSLAA